MKGFFRRYTPALVSGLAVVVVLLLTPNLWLRLDGWVQDQRDRVWAQLEAAVGQRIAYDRIAPNVLAALDFQNVRVVADDGETLFKAVSVRLSWDWKMLFQGKFDQALRRIQIINAVLALDGSRDQDLLDRWAKLLLPEESASTPFGFEVECFNLAATWSDEAQTVSLLRGFAVLSPEGREWGVKFRGALSWEGKGGAPRSVQLSLRGEMRSDAGFRNLSLRTEVSSVRTTWFDLQPISLQATVAPDRISIAKVSDRNPFDLQANWTNATQTWELKGAAEGFQISRLLRLKGMKEWSRVTDGTLTGSFSYLSNGDFSIRGRASWPAGALPSLLSDDLTLQGAVSTQGRAYRLDQFRVNTPRLALLFGGVLGADLLPEGDLSLDHWNFPGLGRAKGTVHLTRSGNELLFTGEDWLWNALGSRSPSGSVEKTPSGWKFSIQGPWDGTDGATYSASGLYHPGTGIETLVEVIGLPLSILRDEARDRLTGFDLPPEIWALETTVRAQVGWDSQGPTVSVTSFAFHDPLVPDRTATGSGSWRGRHLDLALNPASWDSVRAGGLLSADLEDNGVIAGTLKGQLWNHVFDLTGRWVPSDRTLAFSGKPGVAGVFHQNDSGGWQAQLSLDPQELAPGWSLGFVTEASFEGDSWTVDARQIDLTGKYPWNQEAFAARATASIDQDTLNLEALTVTDAHGPWTGSGRSSWSPRFEKPWEGTLSAASVSGRESLRLDWLGRSLDRWHIGVRAALDVTRAPVPTGLQGRIAADGVLDWNQSSLDWTLQTALSEARWGESPLGFRALLSGKNSLLQVRNLNLAVSPLRITDASADVDWEKLAWTGSLGLGLRLGVGDWESRWQLRGGWTGPSVPLRISAQLTARNNLWSGKNYPDWTLAGSWGPDAWDAALGSGLSARGSGTSVAISARDPFPVRGEARGTVGAEGFNLAVTGFYADLALVKDVINSKFFAIGTGTAEGDFSLTGALGDPEVNGRLLVKNLTARSQFVRQTVGPLDVPLLLEGHKLTVEPINIGPGGQTWMFSGGARLDHLLPEEYQFAIQTDSISLIPISYEYTEIAATGGVSGLILLRGTPLSLTLGGHLTVQDAVITLKPTTVETGAGEPLGFNADLTFVTGRKVEFLWPNQTLPLLRAVTAPGQTVLVKANDVASTWSVVGRLGLKTGEINYLNRTFILKEGQLTFREDQSRFDPRIAVRAEWKLREAAGAVIINLRADGTLGTFSPRFDAVPFKSPEELQQLVGTTLALPTDYAKATNIETALSVASDVGTSFLLTPFEETVKRNFQLDLFTVKTEILKKSFLTRNAPLEASDYLDNTRLFFGKYIGDDLFLQGTLAFRRDGSIATQVSPKMVVEPEFQMEFQTPFFLLNWTLLPQHPETLFVTDNTVTFRWNWSY